ncbi:hypothetical protein HanLR1_Chr08g0266201 [Helianthus annuus]|nr:hypothetical protein HanLR1_Chr08g0266201 [Helianthus annuus]
MCYEFSSVPTESACWSIVGLKVKSLVLSDGARALAKHVNRSKGKFWIQKALTFRGRRRQQDYNFPCT